MLLDSVNPFPLTPTPHSLVSLPAPLPPYILLVLGFKPRTLHVLGEALIELHPSSMRKISFQLYIAVVIC